MQRYTYKFTNGFWKTFDNETYSDIAIHYLRKDAKEHCKQLNGKVGI